jgi:cellulose synthase/poly-beta-1,6-N-acetylglucosamine synthase-like glycosyltransferase
MAFAHHLIDVALFWPVCALVFYPLFVYAWRGIRPVPAPTAPDAWPEVTIVVAARNAEADIGPKVRALLALDYPADKLRVLVASDGSTDRTAAVVRAIGDGRAAVLEIIEHVGKTTAVNRAVEQVQSDIIAFSDASTRWEPGSLKAMVAAVAPEGVGCASGRIVYEAGEGRVAGGFALYQKAEVALRAWESGAGLLPSVSGAMHIVKRAHWRPIPPSLTADLVLAQMVHADGAGVVYAGDAIGYETPRETVGKELRARVRIAVRSTRSAMFAVPELLKRGRLPAFFALFSHKILRWTLWIPAACFLVGSLLLAARSPLWATLLLGQILVYTAGVIDLRSGTAILPGKAQSIATYWTLAMWALAKGTLRGLVGEAATRWDPEQ